VRLLVDGMNVIGSRPDGWWRDRDGAARRLVGRLRRLAEASGDEVTVVLDGRPIRDLPEGEQDGVEVLYASRGGRNAADDRIVEVVAASDRPEVFHVITSDRELRSRVEQLGASVAGAGSLLERLDAIDG
jgi:predicted RNA-binding protein with PIN domain